MPLGSAKVIFCEHVAHALARTVGTRAMDSEEAEGGILGF